MSPLPDYTPDLADIEQLAEQALAGIPDVLRQHLEAVVIRVEELPDPQLQNELSLESPYDLLGLYSGVSLADKSVMATAQDLDRIFLYRRPILEYGRQTGEPLARIVRHVLIHEVGHHFGLSDADMERIERDAGNESRSGGTDL
jgi:predicted Zn-dependent protease with MMP-like domain